MQCIYSCGPVQLPISISFITDAVGQSLEKFQTNSQPGQNCVAKLNELVVAFLINYGIQ